MTISQCIGVYRTAEDRSRWKEVANDQTEKQKILDSDG